MIIPISALENQLGSAERSETEEVPQDPVTMALYGTFQVELVQRSDGWWLGRLAINHEIQATGETAEAVLVTLWAKQEAWHEDLLAPDPPGTV